MRKSLRFGCRNVCFFLFCDGNKLISVVQSTTFTTKTQLMHQRNSLHQRRIQPQSKRSRWNYGMHPATIMPNLPSFFSLSLALNSPEENFSSELWVCWRQQSENLKSQTRPFLLEEMAFRHDQRERFVPLIKREKSKQRNPTVNWTHCGGIWREKWELQDKDG